MLFFFFFKQKTAYEMRISDWSSDVCSSDLLTYTAQGASQAQRDEAVIKLMMVDLSYRGGLKSERAGDYSITLSGDPAADRESIIAGLIPARSEERRVGKECVSTCRSRW